MNSKICGPSFLWAGDCMLAVPPNQNRFAPKLLTFSKAFHEHRTAVAISPANVPGTWSSEFTQEFSSTKMVVSMTF